ncbi:MAG TPA: CoA transferase [Dehalococcoidia bacterium]|jgi:crotonobetainyl-CoA:carnitine CoA-transferase CaiB-like acyl-CoA transferase
MNQPLEGIRVLELGMFHAGPAGAAILGDLGAEVIKIEQPGLGDPIRRLAFVGHVHLQLEDGGSIWHEGANRSKKSVTIDLTREKGREIVYRLAAKSDVFLTSIRRSAVDKLEMNYEAISKVNPKIIYAWVSGYGPKGPDRDVGAFDYQGQGRSGMMYHMGEPDMTPLVSQFGIIDQATSIMASHEIITALLMRERFGIGQEVHVSILSTAMYLLYCNILIELVGGFEAPRHQRSKEYPLRNYYKCADGRWFILTAGIFEKYWPPLCKAIGHLELENDDRFNSSEKLLANSAELIVIFDQIFSTRPRDEWLKILAEVDLPVAPVNRLSELTNDRQIMENNYIMDFDHPRLGKIQMPGYPIHFSKTNAITKIAAPDLGEHTDNVLKEIGGYSDDDIARFRKEGVI